MAHALLALLAELGPGPAMSRGSPLGWDPFPLLPEQLARVWLGNPRRWRTGDEREWRGLHGLAGIRPSPRDSGRASHSKRAGPAPLPRPGRFLPVPLAQSRSSSLRAGTRQRVTSGLAGPAPLPCQGGSTLDALACRPRPSLTSSLTATACNAGLVDPAPSPGCAALPALIIRPVSSALAPDQAPLLFFL